MATDKGGQEDNKSSPAFVDTQQWLATFQVQAGRPLRVLHFGNIANNAYNNAKIQRARGIEAHVVAPNYYHIMGCPEWEDAEIKGNIADPLYPDFWSVDIGGFKRPKWFVQGPARLCRSYLLHKAYGNRQAQRIYWRYLQTYRYLLARFKMQTLVNKTARSRSVVRNFVEDVWALPLKLVILFKNVRQRLGFLNNLHEQGKGSHVGSADLSKIKNLHQNHDLNQQDYIEFGVTARFWQPLFEHYDIIQAYSTHPIWPFLCELENYVAYEHGTIREIPFQDDPIGRLSKCAYLAAPAVFITNVDNIRAADRLGLTSKQRFYLPHAFDCHKLIKYAEKCGVKYDPDAPRQIFMPSRQHWVDGDPNWAKGNDNVIRAAKLLKDEGFSPLIKFVNWGNDVEASKELITELGVEEMVIWSPMLNKQQLWEEYLRSMVVIDQFLLPGLSGVSFEAMTLGVPVITHDEDDLNERFFGKAPPLMTASNPEQVASQIKRLMREDGLRETVGKNSARWILDYHAPERIFDIQIEAFRQVLENKTAA